LLLLAFALYVNAWMIIHFLEAYQQLGASADAAPSMSAAVALAYSQNPHTFIVGLLSLMLAIHLTGMAMLSLQNKKYFDELFHLGSTVLREQRESSQALSDPSQRFSRDLPSKQASDRPHRT
jgi:hypothetical protein